MLSTDEIVGLSIDIIASGSLTTLAEICYYLAIYPDVQTKVLNEINEAISDDNDDIMSEWNHFTANEVML
uniref:Cytochrome P450 n=1 Tax=Acrobeloides nanus TaxID=290746 RepID=A0A914E6H6_9BILA